MATHGKRAVKYRFYPTDAQAAELSRTFGCARKVYAMALAARTEAWSHQVRIGHHQTSATLTMRKRTEGPAYPRHERRDRARLARAQREPARKATGSANRERARRTVARVHARITDRRGDMPHKLTTGLVRENPPLVIEDLAVRNMVKNRALARAISDAAWSRFRGLLEYKASW